LPEIANSILIRFNWKCLDLLEENRQTGFLFNFLPGQRDQSLNLCFHWRFGKQQQQAICFSLKSKSNFRPAMQL